MRKTTTTETRTKADGRAHVRSIVRSLAQQSYAFSGHTEVANRVAQGLVIVAAAAAIAADIVVVVEHDFLLKQQTNAQTLRERRTDTLENEFNSIGKLRLNPRMLCIGTEKLLKATCRRLLQFIVCVSSISMQYCVFVATQSKIPALSSSVVGKKSSRVRKFNFPVPESSGHLRAVV